MNTPAQRLELYQAFMVTFGVVAIISTTAWWRLPRRMRALTQRPDAI